MSNEKLSVVLEALADGIAEKDRQIVILKWELEKAQNEIKELKKKMITLILGSVAFVASEIFFIFGTVSYGFADEVAFIGSLLFMLSIIKSIAEVREEIDAKYILQ